ncbi:hypothetical protein BDW62DRAFT_142653 [Aspergillus aurantiobrunneus]
MVILFELQTHYLRWRGLLIELMLLVSTGFTTVRPDKGLDFPSVTIMCGKRELYFSYMYQLFAWTWSRVDQRDTVAMAETVLVSR